MCCTKFDRNRITHGGVIDDLARLRRAIIGGGAQLTQFSQGCVDPNFTKLGKDIGRSSQHCTFISEFGYLAAFSNVAA